MTLRPYQERALAALRDAYREGARRPLLVLPTGAGKTRTLAEAVARAVARGRARASQDAWWRAARAAGALGGIVRSVEDALAYVEAARL